MPGNERPSRLDGRTKEQLEAMQDLAERTGYARGYSISEINEALSKRVPRSDEPSENIIPGESLSGHRGRRHRRFPSPADEIEAARHPEHSRWVSNVIRGRR